MIKEVILIELKKKLELMTIARRQMDELAENNRWKFTGGKIEFDNKNVEKLYTETWEAYTRASEEFIKLENFCLEKHYYDVIKSIVMVKFEKGLI